MSYLSLFLFFNKLLTAKIDTCISQSFRSKSKHFTLQIGDSDPRLFCNKNVHLLWLIDNSRLFRKCPMGCQQRSCQNLQKPGNHSHNIKRGIVYLEWSPFGKFVIRRGIRLPQRFWKILFVKNRGNIVKNQVNIE